MYLHLQNIGMKKLLITSIVFCLAFAKADLAHAQSLRPVTGTEIIKKSIAYHDPNGHWPTFKGEFTLSLEMPEKAARKSVITLDIPNEYFNLTTEQDGDASFREISNDTCKYTAEAGEVITTTTDSDECERTRMYRDYYSYLYGLPMKLNDPGTQIDPTVKNVTFKGKKYIVVKVTYDEAVGSDVWQFYFNPSTYALEVYQFFKGTDETTGEYILLDDIAVIEGIKMPKNRAWYYNKDDGYLGTDILIED